MRRLVAACSILTLVAIPLVVADAAAEKPAALVADGVPPIPDSIPAATRPYMEYRTARLMGWNPVDRSMLIATRFADTNQLHRVQRPMGARQQISFEEEPVLGTWSPNGDVLVARKDIGGNEFYQLYMLKDGKLRLLTDGKSRNEFGSWSRDGKWIGYVSTRRNGTDADLYVIDPRDPKTDRMVVQVKGGGWDFSDFAPDARSAVVTEYISIAKSNLHLLDLSTGALTPIGDHRKTIAYRGPQFAPDGTLWVLSDEGSDFLRLGTIDAKTGKFTPKSTEKKWDVTEFDIAEDGSFIAYVLNEAGSSVIKVMDPKSGEVRTVSGLPKGVANDLEIAPWGAIGFTLASARSPSDTYSVDPKTLAVERWTVSETGGLDPNVNVEPELVEVASFDKEPISGFCIDRIRSAFRASVRSS